MVWVLRDGFGMIGSLLFSYAASSHMDSNIKEWRLFADIANDVGLTLDLVAPIFRDNFALVSSLGTVCKASDAQAPPPSRCHRQPAAMSSVHITFFALNASLGWNDVDV